MSQTISRRSLLAAVPAGAALAAMPGIASAASARTVTLRPGGVKTLTFSLGSAGYTMTAVVHSNDGSPLPFLTATASWPSGPSQRWVLAGSQEPRGQRFTGTGPVQGSGMLAVKLASEDEEYPLHVALSFTSAASAPAGHAWMQVSNRSVGSYYPLGESDTRHGLVVRSRTGRMGAGAQAIRYMPLFPGAVVLRARSFAGEGQVLVTSAEPGYDDTVLAQRTVRPGRDTTAHLSLPQSPCCLTFNNLGAHGQFAASVSAK